MGPIKMSGWNTSRLASNATRIPMMAITAVTTRRASNSVPPHSGNCVVRFCKLSHCLNHPGPESLPGKLLRTEARPMPHLRDLGAMIQSPIDTIGDEVWPARLGNENTHPPFDEVGSRSPCSGENWKTARESFQQDQPEAFRHGWENKHICGLIGGNQLG